MFNAQHNSPQAMDAVLPNPKKVANRKYYVARTEKGDVSLDSKADMHEWNQGKLFPSTTEALLQLPEDEVLILPGAPDQVRPG